MKITVITPGFNAQSNIDKYLAGLLEQTNNNWDLYFVDDCSTDRTVEFVEKMSKNVPEKIHICKNAEKKYALKNIYDTMQLIRNQETGIVAIIDADDCLCNPDAFQMIADEYEKDSNLDCLWTAHRWDTDGKNISRDLPKKINPYQYPWVTSHMKTFRSDVFYKISEDNFKDNDGNWFVRGYDQALYLPILFLSRERKYLDKVCYQYNIKSPSISPKQRAEDSNGAQVRTVNLIRARGFVSRKDGNKIETLYCNPNSLGKNS